MNEINDILDVARIIQQGQTKADKKHWQEIANKIAVQEQESIDYDAKLVLESKFLKKRRIVLENVIKLVEAFKWRFNKDIICPIACTEIELQRAVAKNGKLSHRNLSKIICNAVKLGIIKLESDYNYFVSQSKCYSFNEFIYNKIVDLANSEYKINNQISTQDLSYHIVELYGENDKNTNEIPVEFDESRICICKRMKMDITNISIDRIKAVLDKKYPMFVEGRKIVNQLNKSLNNLEQIIWQWNLDVYKKDDKIFLRKIGFRATNKICNYKEHINENPYYKGIWRRDYLESRLGKDYNHFDVNGSIWRLSYNLVHDELMSNDVDAYEIAYGSKFDSPEDRDLFKKIAMRLYFGGINVLGVQVENKFKEIAETLGEKYVYSRERKQMIDEAMIEAKLVACENIGGFFDSEIFLHESFIYLKMFKRLKDLGLDVIQVYDSFYFKSDKELNLLELYYKIISDYKTKYKQLFKFITTKNLSYHIVELYGAKNEMRKSRRTKAVKYDDLPEEFLEDKKSKVVGRLQEFIDKQYISLFEAGVLANVAGKKMNLKESRYGWSINDRNNPKNQNARKTIFLTFISEFKEELKNDIEQLNRILKFMK